MGIDMILDLPHLLLQKVQVLFIVKPVNQGYNKLSFKELNIN